MDGFTKLRAPDEFCMMTLNGREIKADDSHAVWVLPTEVEDLLSHGFKTWYEPGAVTPIADMTSGQLRDEVLRRTLASLDGLSDDDLRSRLLASTPADASLPGETGAMAPPAKPDADYVMGLSHAGLVEFCKSRDLRAHAGISKATLRDMAMNSLKSDAVDETQSEEAFAEEAE